MGMFTVAVEVLGAPGRGSRTIEPLVDTGAGFSVLPANLLEELGVQAIEEQEFLLADEVKRVYGVGEVRFRIDGRERTTPVVFGNDGVELLGAVTLQIFGLVADTTRHCLVPARLLLVGVQPGLVAGKPAG